MCIYGDSALLPVDFIIKVIVITSSGALSPGPLTVSVMKKGVEEGSKAGLLASLGHMVVEFPLVYLIGLGLVTFLLNDFTIYITGLIGALFILAFGILTLRDAWRGVNLQVEQNDNEKESIIQSSFLIGLNLTAFNPFFIVWWIGIGAALAVEAFRYAGYLGILEMYIAHVWMDFAWLIAIAFLVKTGTSIMERKGYRILLLVIGLLLLYFGVTMIINILSL